ncbi:ZCW7 [Forsythia ovata]|uniref:ZCW7 n=1 Tax=Forsythia ovata TaxID=205694 RepID=A0ABD1RLX1_9LAMI
MTRDICIGLEANPGYTIQKTGVGYGPVAAATMSSHKPLENFLPTETFELETGLSIVPRVKLNLTIHRADKSVTPIDDWKLKRSLIDYLKTSHSITVPEEDIIIRKYKDPKKRKREDPVARGNLFVRDLGFLTKMLDLIEEMNEVKVVEKKFLEWRKGIVERMDGIELNLEGVKFKLSIEVPALDDFEGMRKEWEEISAFGAPGYARGSKQQPDTIIVRGVPSRWFAETRVSSKPSMLVTHTIFSAFGNIRNLDVAEDNDLSKDDDEDGLDIISGLQCKIVVRFKDHRSFYNALKVLCGRSLKKQGSRLLADYEVTWDKDSFFKNSRSQPDERSRWVPARLGNYGTEDSRRSSQNSWFSTDDARRKRFKE